MGIVCGDTVLTRKGFGITRVLVSIQFFSVIHVLCIRTGCATHTGKCVSALVGKLSSGARGTLVFETAVSRRMTGSSYTSCEVAGANIGIV